MQKFDIVKIIGENQVTRLEAVLARMVELEASQDPYMLQVIDLVILSSQSCCHTKHFTPFQYCVIATTHY